MIAPHKRFLTKYLLISPFVEWIARERERERETSDSSAFLNAVMYLLKCMQLNCQQYFPFFKFRYELAESRISEGLLCNTS
jgi:hypothetical protein